MIPNKKKGGYKQKAQLTWWRDRLGDYLLSVITPALVAESRDFLLKGITPRGTKRSPATAVRYLAALSIAFTVACKEWGWIEDSPSIGCREGIIQSSIKKENGQIFPGFGSDHQS